VRTTTGEIVIPAYLLRRVLHRAERREAILRSNLFKIDVRRDPQSGKAQAVIASGGGSGHGVGLCQTGALGMARSGHDATRILTHYYPGTELKRLY
jgi:stage II sporulation protein D